MRSQDSKTFADYYTNQFQPHICNDIVTFGCQRIDLVWDRYVIPSIKCETREKKVAWTRKEVYFQMYLYLKIGMHLWEIQKKWRAIQSTSKSGCGYHYKHAGCNNIRWRRQRKYQCTNSLHRYFLCWSSRSRLKNNTASLRLHRKCLTKYCYTYCR